MADIEPSAFPLILDDEARRDATQKLVLKELYGRLWHTTREDRFTRILTCGEILPNPEIPDCDRWKTARGEHYYPYVRTIGGVSLFDFNQFEPESYSKKCGNSSWYEFVPYLRHWGHAVWIEIDRAVVASKFISGVDIVARWKADNAYQHTIMPYIEAAHVGPIPRCAFKRAFLVRGEKPNLEELDLLESSD